MHAKLAMVSCGRKINHSDNSLLLPCIVQGDAFVMAFHEARDAVSWAVIAQQVRVTSLTTSPHPRLPCHIKRHAL